MERITRLETFARAGFLARGIVYILLGYFALTTAASTGTGDVLEAIGQVPLGTVLLALVGLGLLGYGFFRLYGAAIDFDGEGDDAKGAAMRVGHAASGLAHFVLAYLAFQLALGNGGSSGGGAEGAAAGATASAPGGEILLGIVGAGFLAAALSQLARAVTGKFMRDFDADAPHWSEYLGRAGYAARAVVFATIGGQLLSMALGGGNGEVGLEAALNSLRDTGWLYMLVAFGLLLFGLFSLVMARYRRICDEDVLRRLSGGRVTARR
jgi:hypothetical protein